MRQSGLETSHGAVHHTQVAGSSWSGPRKRASGAIDIYHWLGNARLESQEFFLVQIDEIITADHVHFEPW